MTESGNVLARGRKVRAVMLCCVGVLLIFCFFAELNSIVRADEGIKKFSNSNSVATLAGATNNLLRETPTQLTDTNSLAVAISHGQVDTNNFNVRLAMARYLDTTRQPEKAEPILVSLLAQNVPDSIQKAALFELATAAQAENDLPRAQSIYAQYLDRWPLDPRTPEILLHQGRVFRQMGLNELALSKFYAVMTTALSLKGDQLNYYQQLVLQAQEEIAETEYLEGKFADAAEFYTRLLQKADPTLNRTQIEFRLIRSLLLTGSNAKVVAQAQDFIAHFPDAPEEPEVRYDLAQALKALGRNDDALQQVLLFLQEEKAKTQDDPETWAYWQQRVGNEIANELYKEGDYVRALEIYINLAKLDSAPEWQLPVYYQMGITYERLLQPQKAIDTYNEIISQQAQLGTNVTPGLKAVFDMARWRINFLQWQSKAEAVNLSLSKNSASITNAPTEMPHENSINN